VVAIGISSTPTDTFAKRQTLHFRSKGPGMPNYWDRFSENRTGMVRLGKKDVRKEWRTMCGGQASTFCSQREGLSLVRGLVFTGAAAGFAVKKAVVAQTDVDDRLAETAEFFALAGTFWLFALCALVFGGAGSVAHENNVAQESGGWNVTEVIVLTSGRNC
jgi:hypothetical protein